MCVILYVPSKKELKEKFLKNAFEGNPDGAGVMSYDWNGNVVYKKGFMTYKALKKYWQGLDDRLPRAVHCRIATSGAINEQNCHPFKIADNIEAMKETEGIAKDGLLMHNGVLRDYAPKEGLKSNYSDTMAFNMLVINPLVRGNCIDNEGVKKLIDGLGNRFLLFLPHYKVIMFGDWETASDGFFASNDSYLGSRYGSCFNGYYGLDWGEGFSLSDIRSDEVFPRYQYEIQFECDDEGDDLFSMIDDFVEDMGEWIIDTNEPYESFIDDDEGVVRFTVSAYSSSDFEKFLPKRYEIIHKNYINYHEESLFEEGVDDTK